MRRIPGIRRVFRHERGSDVDVELQFHIDARTDDLVRSGLDLDAARRAALAEFGDMKRYESETLRIDRGYARTTRIKEFLWSVLFDLGYSLRGLRRSPGFAAAAVLTLAIGIGANTAVWTILDALMRQSLPLERPEELHAVWRADRPDDDYLVSLPRFQRLQRVIPDPEQLTAMSAFARMYATNGDQPEPALVQLVSGNWFRALRVGVRAGRAIDVNDDGTVDGAAVAVLSDAFWMRRFGGDRRVIGTSIRVNGVPLRVIGVAEPGFQGLTVGSSVDLWAPLSMQGPLRYIGNFSANNSDPQKPWGPQEGISWLTILARVPPVTAERIGGALDRQFRGELEQEVAKSDSVQRAFALREHISLRPIPRGFSPLRDEFKDPLRVLMASVGLVLLIACGNLAGLLLARSSARSHEIAVRISLGARRGRLVRQVLTDSLTIALLGGALGVIIARWGTAMLLRVASSGSQPIPLDVSHDLRIVGFVLVISLVTGLLVGGLPAMRASRFGLYDAFRTAGRVTGGRSAHHLPLGRALVISQIALSLVLVVTAGVFVRTLRNLLDIDPGYDREHVVVARIDARAARYEPAQLPALYDRLLGAASSIPGVRSASISQISLAGGGIRMSGFSVPGRTLPPGTNAAQENYVTPDYFGTLGMTLVQGRAFTRADNAAGPKVAIVSESMARHFFGTDKVIGARFGYDQKPDVEIVGVVRDARVNALRQAPPRLVYRPLAQGTQEYASGLEVRVGGPRAPVVAGLRQAIRQVDPNLPLREIVTLTDLLERGLTSERLVARLAGVFGVLALMLAGIGLYGVMGYSVSRRTNEMGVRLALGASPGGVRLLVLRESLVTSIAGVVLGLALLTPIQGLTRQLVYGISPRDPMTVALGTVLLFAVTALAAFVPAWRASRIDPIDAIRSA
jgi:predicted permease